VPQDPGLYKDILTLFKVFRGGPAGVVRALAHYFPDLIGYLFYPLRVA